MQRARLNVTRFRIRFSDCRVVRTLELGRRRNLDSWSLWFVWMLIGVLLAGFTGCANTHQRLIQASAFATEGLVTVKRVRRETGNSYLHRLMASIPPPSERTALLLRKYNLTTQYEEDPDAVIQWFEELAQSRPTMEEVHALAEMAEIHASWSARQGQTDRATRLYLTSSAHAYQFLFDSKLNLSRNAYDPQFRSICDVYNRSLEGLVRQIIAADQMRKGEIVQLGSGDEGVELEIRMNGRWREQEFSRFELVNDFITNGIENQYRTYGLGVPLIAVRQHQSLHSQFEKYYPPEITIPLTAFLHFSSVDSQISRSPDDLDPSRETNARHAVLTLYDPLESTVVQTESRTVPLESDISTPLAYGLRDPEINKQLLATASLLDAEFAPESYGLFMLEPYDPNKIPVVMVHGFWSSPVTWVHMFNDLRANRDIHENYQFWFYSYPTGQPFWISAQQMRNDLIKIRRDVDPRGDSQALDKMVLVGHSMGGLMSLMQTIDSGDEFWNTISSSPIESLSGDPDAIQLLRDTFYFQPNESVSRVITLATPFQGSEFSNKATQWVSKKLFTLPTILTDDFQKLARQNKDRIDNSICLTTTTSTDSLAPGHPLLGALQSARSSKAVKLHNIIGRLEKKSFLKPQSAESTPQGDGIVSIESASNERALSQQFVPEEHSDIHKHPGSILEVRRILLEHLAENDRIQPREIPEIPGAHVMIPSPSQENTVPWEPQSGPPTRMGAMELPATRSSRWR